MWKKTRIDLKSAKVWTKKVWRQVVLFITPVNLNIMTVLTEQKTVGNKKNSYWLLEWSDCFSIHPLLGNVKDLFSPTIRFLPALIQIYLTQAIVVVLLLRMYKKTKDVYNTVREIVVVEFLCTHRASGPAPRWSQRTRGVCWQSRRECQSPPPEPAGWTAGCWRAGSWWSIRRCSSGRLCVWCSDTAACCWDSSTGRRALTPKPRLHSYRNRAKRRSGRADKAPSPLHLQTNAEDEEALEKSYYKYWCMC